VSRYHPRLQPGVVAHERVKAHPAIGSALQEIRVDERPYGALRGRGVDAQQHLSGIEREVGAGVGRQPAVRRLQCFGQAVVHRVEHDPDQRDAVDLQRVDPHRIHVSGQLRCVFRLPGQRRTDETKRERMPGAVVQEGRNRRRVDAVEVRTEHCAKKHPR